MREMSDFEWGWVVGLFEGEGWFGPQYAGGGVQAQIVSTDLDVIERVHALTGAGSIRGPYHAKGERYKKPWWYWSIGGKNALEFGEKLVPHLSARRLAKMEEMVAKRRAYLIERQAPRECVGCGITFTPPHEFGRPPKFCTSKCRDRYHSRKNHRKVVLV